MRQVPRIAARPAVALLATALALALPATGARAATVAVTSSADSGAGTLRAAIDFTNTLAGPDTIEFAIGSGVVTIAPASPLPEIAGPLTIDGTTQPGFVGTPLVELDGASAGASATGLTVGVAGAGSVIKGLVVGNFDTGSGISVAATATAIRGNWIGANTAGAVRPNGTGINVLTGASATVGGISPTDRNIIAGNIIEGVSLNANSASATILGNHIGITPAGVRPNKVGVVVNGVAASASVGAFGARNVISGNTTAGIQVAGTSTATIDNNYVGLGPDGTTSAGNLGTGISIGSGAVVEIGGADGNVISDNGVGVQLDGTITRFANNRIGTDASGSLPRGNGTGVLLLGPEITIGGDTPATRNVISDNTVGVQVAGGADRATIAGNYIGVTAAGSAALGNASSGISVEAGATEVTIGGVLRSAEQSTIACDGACNVVSGGSGAGDTGIEVAATADGVTILGNAIGTRADGTLPAAASVFANATGIDVDAQDATIGGFGADGVSPAARNVIAGRTPSGVGIGIDASGANLAILGNHVGVLADGATAAGLATGVRITGAGASRRVGDTLTAAALATAACDGACNVIAASITDDVNLTGGATVVRGNRIGTNSAGTASLGAAASDGIQAAANQVIGGASPGDRNLISGHGGGMGVRVTGNAVTISGNDIGTAAGGDAGTPALRNDTGIWIEGGANVIVGGEVPLAAVGGACDGACNVLSNNFSAGVVVAAGASAQIAGNHIGVTRSGTAALGNTIAGVSHRSSGTVAIGGTTAGRRNVVSGNEGSGIETTSAGSGTLTVQGNYLGTAADGTAPAPNGGAGIHVATGATIGGAGAAANRIARNIGDGVFVAPEATGATTVLENEISANGQLGIDLGIADEPAPGVTPNDADDADAGANSLQNFPALAAAARGFGGSVQVRGALDGPAGSYTLRVYANDACDPSAHGEAAQFVGAATVASGPSFSVAVPVTGVAPALAQVLTATVTNAAGQTSELSPCVAVGNAVRLASAGYAVSETAGTATIAVERAVGAGAQSVRVDTVAGGSASAGADYTAGQHVVQFEPGQTTTAAAIGILDDLLVEGPETVNLALTNPSAGLDLGAPPLRDGAVLTIMSDDVAPAPPPPPPPPPPAPGGGPAPANPVPPPPAASPASREPDSDLDRLARSIAASRLKRVAGSASDPDGDLVRVELALVSVAGGASPTATGRKCRHYGRSGRVVTARAVPGRRCLPRTWLRATGTTRWIVRLPRRLPRGVWTIYARAVDGGGRRETSFTAQDRNRAVLRIKRG